MWSRQCPSGYWCQAGTVTSNVTSTESPRPMPCAEGTYCMIGVSTNITSNALDAPQICNAGTYCLAATGSPQGTALCPAGYFCGQGISNPEPAHEGHYSSRPGLVADSPCAPGTFSPRNASILCYPCPAGQECINEGMALPTVCPPANFRPAGQQISCMKCPQGTWAPAPDPLTVFHLHTRIFLAFLFLFPWRRTNFQGDTFSKIFSFTSVLKINYSG